MELMISLTIGLIIAIAAISAYMGASNASKMTDAQSRMNEDAQAALTILAQHIRMAGNNPGQANRVVDANPTLASTHNPVYVPAPTYAGYTNTFNLTDFAIRGCDGKFTNIATAGNLDALSCPGGTSTLPDSIAVSYEADKYNTVPTTAGLATDCLGNALATQTATIATTAAGTSTTALTAINFSAADNRFYIGTSTAIVSPSLYCKGNGGLGNAQPLVENIENLQFQYGTVSTATTSTTAPVAGYLSADDVVTNVYLAALANDAQRWAKVVTVRVCVVVRSEFPVVSDAASAKYRDCDGTLVNAPDLRLRRAYFTTVALRNRRS